MWLQLGGSLAAILLLAGFARLLKLGESKIADAATARRMAEEALAGFEARNAIVSADGNAALVLGSAASGGTVAVVKRHGAKVAVRRLVPPIAGRRSIEGVTILTGERMFGAVTLFGVTDDQVQQLIGPLAPPLTLV